MISFDKDTRVKLIKLYEEKSITLEGNVLKLISCEDDIEFKNYLDHCINKDKESRKRRLEITKKVQQQNKELTELNSENERIMNELKHTLENVEHSKSQIESQNKELITWKDDNERLTKDLQLEMYKSEQARVEAEQSKTSALNDLDLLQKKTQTELIGKIVRVSLMIILSVGIVTTGLYIIAIFTNKETQIIGSTWSNMLGILLTNAFSIIGTIMGVKYASEKKE